MAATNETPSHIANVFGIPELCEKILLELDPEDLLNHLQHDVALNVRAQVKASASLQRKLFLKQDPVDPNTVEQDWRITHWKPNRIICPEKGRVAPNYRMFRIGETCYELNLWNEHPRALYSDRGKETFEYRLIATPYQGLDLLAPDCFNMYLSDLAEPIRIRVCDATQRHSQRGTWVWVPAGKTFGEVMRWFEVWRSGAIKEGDVLNGFYQWWPLGLSTLWRFPRERLTKEEYRLKYETGPLVRHGDRLVPRVIREELREEEQLRKAAKEDAKKAQEQAPVER